MSQLKETVGVRGGGKALLSTSILPTTPVTINWHGQRMEKICEQWLVSGALKLNPRLRLCPRTQDLALHAITRLDVSSNALTSLPPLLFTLSSLTYLNLSLNKIQTITFPKVISAPLLQELLLQVRTRIRVFYICIVRCVNCA
jgi:Leucine-rich repeat (LRR) protein